MQQIWNENDERLSQFTVKVWLLLLEVVFENFRNSNLKNYGLCPSHFLSTPAFSWDGVVNITKVELELIPDPDMYIFFEKGTRGGVSYFF